MLAPEVNELRTQLRLRCRKTYDTLRGAINVVRRYVALLAILLTLIGSSIGVAAAQPATTLNLPPGIAKQAQPLLDNMMAHMQQMNLSPEQMQMMMADMQAMADQLPPGIFLQLLKLMPQMDMSAMMQFHQAIHSGDLLQSPPGQILKFARELAG